MTDLREQIFGRPLTDAEQVFLDYHRHSPWAMEKVKIGVHLFPESVTYMQRELAERARALDEYKAKLEQENAEKSAAQTPPPAADAERDAGAASVGGRADHDPPAD